jgi:hypothetical protein
MSAQVRLKPKLINHNALQMRDGPDGVDGLSGVGGGISYALPLADAMSYCDIWLSSCTVTSPESGLSDL